MRDRGLVLRNVPPLPHLAANFSKRALVFRNVPYFARFETAVLLHRFDSSFEVLTGDQVDDFNAVGQETEEKAEIDADALLDNGFSALQAFGALVRESVKLAQHAVWLSHEAEVLREMIAFIDGLKILGKLSAGIFVLEDAGIDQPLAKFFNHQIRLLRAVFD